MTRSRDLLTAFNADPDPLLLVRGDLTIAAVNQAFLKKSLRLHDEIVGNLIFDVFPEVMLHVVRRLLITRRLKDEGLHDLLWPESQTRLISLQDLVDHGPGFVGVTRGPGHIVEALNDAFRRIVFHRHAIGKSMHEIMPEQAAHGIFEMLDRVYKTAEPHLGRGSKILLQRVPGAPPDEAYVDFACQPLFAIDHRVTGLLLFGVEVTAQVNEQESLRISEERLHLALEAAGDGVWDWEIENGIFTFSKRGRAMLGYDEDDIGNKLENWLAITHPEDQQHVQQEALACMRGDTPFFSSEYRVRSKNGNWKWLLARGAVVNRDRKGQALRMVGTTVDISSEQEIMRRANFDALTGLANRNLFRDRLEYEVRNARRNGRLLALLFIDLDRFKEVNDLLGHDAGDALLREVARRIRSCVRNTDTVSRLGGDEFTVILSDLDDRAHVENIAQKILSVLAQPFMLVQELIHVSGSIGITLYPADAMEPEHLLRNADQAMYVAKNAGRNQFSFFTSSMQEQARRRIELIGELRNALPAHQLKVYFQPIVDLRDGHIAKGEALLRWDHPQKGMICPGEFIGLAEETGLIHEIGNWVFMEAALCSRQWSGKFGPAFQISVNRSPAQFLPHKREMNWGAYLRRLGMDKNNIAVEITEGLLLNASASTADRIFELHDAGVEVAIDDFGTGYSSMSYLKKFDVDYLKIDRSFIRDSEKNGAGRTIAETIIVMAHKLGLKVIAEGVETAEQRDWLKSVACDYAQGFLFSPALPPQEFEKLHNKRLVNV